MKKLLLLVITISSLSVSAQNDEGVFFDLNIGARFAGASSEFADQGAGLNITGATGYMFSNIIGIRGVLGFDSFKTSTEGMAEGVATTVEDKSYMLRGTLEAVLSISQLAKFDVENFDLNFHAGFGFASHVNPSWKDDRLAEEGFEFEDPALKGNDDMINVVFGLTPKYHINENISIIADFSYVMLMMKDHTNDRYNNVAVDGLDGVVNASVGISYRL
ncbi:MAG: outer membrane beta-barrel protein [Flavobacteriales bacterium]|nr:outer membrane beta-barrel protein [Flavobacteriales bacterium]